MSEAKPHGTMAAYRRHRRHGETPCDPCKQAAREVRHTQYVKDKQREEEKIIEAAKTVPDEDDPATILRESLRLLRGHEQVATAKEAPAVARAIRETLDALKTLEEPAVVEKVSVLDEIAQRRNERAKNRGQTATG